MKSNFGRHVDGKLILGQVSKVRALASKDAKKKTYFAFSNAILSILPIHFTIHFVSQFLFLHTTQ